MPTMALISTVFVAALIQPNKNRLFSAVIFSFFTILHPLIFINQIGFVYYSSAALFNLLVIISLSKLVEKSDTALQLQIISLASIIINGAGFLMYSLRLSPAVYNYLFLVVYLSAVFVLLRKDREADGRGLGGCALFALCSNFFINVCSRTSDNKKRVRK